MCIRLTSWLLRLDFFLGARRQRCVFKRTKTVLSTGHHCGDYSLLPS